MSISSAEWIKILKTLDANPTARIRCPSCGKADLKLTDCPIKDKVERWIHCPACNERTSALMNARKIG